MSEVVLQINDEVSLDRVVSLLSPYIVRAELKQASAEPKRKIWDGQMECLQHPWKVDSFTPLSREEAHAR